MAARSTAHAVPRLPARPRPLFTPVSGADTCAYSEYDQSAYGCGQAPGGVRRDCIGHDRGGAEAAPDGTSPRMCTGHCSCRPRECCTTLRGTVSSRLCAFAVISCRARTRPFALSARLQPATAASCSACEPHDSFSLCTIYKRSLVPLGPADDLEIAGIVLHLDV